MPAVIHPKFHHFNLKTTRLQEMIDFYRVAGRRGGHPPGRDRRLAVQRRGQPPDRAAGVPELQRRPRQGDHTGLHHSAFEYASFDELNATYLRLKEAGITPALCLDHGMTFSYYYADPDGNNVELQVDNFGDWAKSTEWMRTSAEFRANPIGQFVDPDPVAADHADGMSFAEIHAKAMAGGYAPAQAPVEIPGVSS